MIHYRPFRNCDPPGIAEIWCSQAPSQGLMQPMTPGLLDQLVLSKPYFDRHGLIVAEDHGHLIGFVHAGFGPNEHLAGLDRGQGITCLLMVSPHRRKAEIAAELLKHSEQYLAEGGATSVFGGSLDTRSPFYLGLYGGSAAPGVLLTDETQLDAFHAAGYEEEHRTRILHRELAGFRPLVDRRIIQLKRELHLEASSEAVPDNWWDACTFGQLDRTSFVLTHRKGGPAWGVARFWDIEPLASSWGVHAMGLLGISLREDLRDGQEQPHLTSFLLGESIRQLQSCGVTLVEVQSDGQDALLAESCHRLGFREVNQGIRFRKPA